VDWQKEIQSLRQRAQAYLKTVWDTIPVQRVNRRWMRLPPAIRALPIHLWRAIMNFKERGTRQAASLSYYAVFSVFPMILLLATGISAILGPAVAQEQIAQGLVLFLPEEGDTINLLQDSVEQALQQSGSFGLVALVGLTWSALGLFSNLTSSMDIIFQAPASRSMWRQRVQAFTMTLVLIILVIISFVTYGVLRLMDAFLLVNQSIWITIGMFSLPLSLNIVIFVLMLRYVPSRDVSWDAIWPAAILGAVGWELGKLAFAWYLSNLEYVQFVYGGIATVIVLMLWAFLSACIFLISAELCSELNLWLDGLHEAPRVHILPEGGLSELPAEIPPPV
jgi:membrane protein